MAKKRSNHEPEAVKTAVGYIRVSTPRQETEGISLAAQEARGRAYCQLHGLTLTRIIRDPEAISAGTPLMERKGGAEVLSLIAGAKIQHVIATKLDRLFRSAKDCLNHVDEWRDKGVALHLLDMGGQSINTASSSGMLFVTMLAGFAEFEKNLISERTQAALLHLRNTGRAYSAITLYGVPKAR